MGPWQRLLLAVYQKALGLCFFLFLLGLFLFEAHFVLTDKGA